MQSPPLFPKCLIITGRPASGKNTLSNKLAEKRYQQRSLVDSNWGFYHGRIPPPAQYIPPNFNLPTIHVSTENGYTPNLDEITNHIQSLNAQ